MPVSDAGQADRFAIRELIEHYSDALNIRDFEALAALFTPTATWQVDAPYNLQFEAAAIAPGIAAMIDHVSFLFQMTHSIVITLNGGQATARTAVQEIGKAANGATGLNSFGIYHDHLLRSATGWHFTSRRFQPLYLDTAALPGIVVQ